MKRKRGALYGLLAISIVAAVQPRRLLVVMGGSMAPTYRNGELLWTLPVDRPLHRGDVVVIDTSEGTVVKRVALVAGDRHLEWRGRDGRWTELLRVSQTGRFHKDRIRECRVPDGTIYVLGDHLSTSVDSRDFGPVEVCDVRRIVADVRRPDQGSEIAQASPKWRVS